MNIRETSEKLLKIYADMAESFSTYQASTGLACLTGCGRCCLNPDVEATVVEMIPFALKVHDEGKMEEWLTRLEKNLQSYCVLYVGDENGQGKCGHYNERASICRMFGVAGYSNKEGQPVLSICKYIRENDPSKTSLVEKNLDPAQVPMMKRWSSLVTHLGDPALERKLPINEAIQQALEKVAFYAQYQKL